MQQPPRNVGYVIYSDYITFCYEVARSRPRRTRARRAALPLLLTPWAFALCAHCPRRSCDLCGTLKRAGCCTLRTSPPVPQNRHFVQVLRGLCSICHIIISPTHHLSTRSRGHKARDFVQVTRALSARGRFTPLSSPAPWRDCFFIRQSVHDRLCGATAAPFPAPRSAPYALRRRACHVLTVGALYAIIIAV
uniref:Uncharacterized protein n=1 Tax=uncultured prokaryote TaxID=198431 RepID=A0A0H5Q1R0_9ZZZZ|nr:hypothetical protein [uncultured prokaryote]